MHAFADPSPSSMPAAGSSCRSGTSTRRTTLTSGACPVAASRTARTSATAAVRELAEETGLVVDPDRLDSAGRRPGSSATSCGEEDEFELFAVRLDVTDDGRGLRRGTTDGLRRPGDLRRPRPAPGRAAARCPGGRLARRRATRRSAASPASSSSTRAAGSCSRSATSTRASTRRSGGWPAATSSPARTSRPAPTASSRRRPGCGSSPASSSCSASSWSTTGAPTAPGTGCRSSSPPPTSPTPTSSATRAARSSSSIPPTRPGLDLTAAAADHRPGLPRLRPLRRARRSCP